MNEKCSFQQRVDMFNQKDKECFDLQLKFSKLEQENEKLKEQYNDIYDYLQEREKLINGTIQDLYKAKQENEELQEKFLTFNGKCYSYKQALEEIREMAKIQLFETNDILRKIDYRKIFENILTKIKEVLK